MKPECEARFWAKVDVGHPLGCWEWTAYCSPDGYGRFGNGDDHTRTVMAHRVAYGLLRGAIPEGLTVDHLCMNTRCVNPDHMELVPRGVNTLRNPRSPQNYWARRDRCSKGHPFDTVTARGQRRCSICAREWRRRYAGVV